MKPRDRIDRYSTTKDELEVSRVEPFTMQDLDQRHNLSRMRQDVDGSVVDTTTSDDDDSEREMDEE